ncbi:hypothetical protein KVR01_010485 [Diaporthe batatas]|uniref:uncharacterized protein n=1 Tax=Diaporthe batatas TaxID=748121 RepID=UPI001D03EDFD|nr:uncharacterized protein KVR01_010485 [Diaporthe batatas]KAG8159848.1 hypothetical protein KVR01_010485 [Diaporthe batatas]
MADEGKMDGGKQSGGSTDHHDGDKVCGDTQLVPMPPYKRADQSVPATAFHYFLQLPWELRRNVWVFALPRTVFMSTVLRPTDCVPYPPMGRACREARLVAKEFGSMVTAWREHHDGHCWRGTHYDGRCWRGHPVVNPGINYDVPNKAEVCVRTWFSSKLDTLVLDMWWLCPLTEHRQNDLIDFTGIERSATTHLVLQGDRFGWHPRDLEYVYRTCLKRHTEVLLSIRSFSFILKDQDYDTNMGLDISPRPGERGRVIRLDDTVALTKYLKLWNEWRRSETCPIIDGDYSFESWLETALDSTRAGENKREKRKYMAWNVEDQSYEQRLVSPEAYFLLRTVDSIIHKHTSVEYMNQDMDEDTDQETGQETDQETDERSVRRANEIMDDTGRLKEDHPLVQNLDIKLPQVIPVYTLSFLWRGLS